MTDSKTFHMKWPYISEMHFEKMGPTIKSSGPSRYNLSFGRKWTISMLQVYQVSPAPEGASTVHLIWTSDCVQFRPSIDVDPLLMEKDGGNEDL